MITGAVPSLPAGRRVHALRAHHARLAQRLMPGATPEITDIPLLAQRRGRGVAYEPVLDEERFPVYLGDLPRPDRLAAARVTVDLARAASPAAHVFTVEALCVDVHGMKDALSEYLMEMNHPDTEATPGTYEVAVRDYEYEGGNPFRLEQHLAELEALPSPAEVLARADVIGDAMRLTVRIAALTAPLHPVHASRDPVVAAALEDTGPWTPPLLTTQFTDQSDIEDLVDELHQEHYQYAREIGRTRPTAVYRLDRPRQRRQLARLMRLRDDLTAAVLDVGNLLLRAGGRIEARSDLQGR